MSIELQKMIEHLAAIDALNMSAAQGFAEQHLPRTQEWPESRSVLVSTPGIENAYYKMVQQREAKP